MFVFSWQGKLFCLPPSQTSPEMCQGWAQRIGFCQHASYCSLRREEKIRETQPHSQANAWLLFMVLWTGVLSVGCLHGSPMLDDRNNETILHEKKIFPTENIDCSCHPTWECHAYCTTALVQADGNWYLIIHRQNPYVSLVLRDSWIGWQSVAELKGISTSGKCRMWWSSFEQGQYPRCGGGGIWTRPLF